MQLCNSKRAEAVGNPVYKFLVSMVISQVPRLWGGELEAKSEEGFGCPEDVSVFYISLSFFSALLSSIPLSHFSPFTQPPFLLLTSSILTSSLPHTCLVLPQSFLGYLGNPVMLGTVPGECIHNGSQNHGYTCVHSRVEYCAVRARDILGY